MADQNIDLTVRVNSETGQIDVANAKLKETTRAAQSAGGAFGKMGGEASSLLRTLLPFATATGVLAFFKSAVSAADEEAEALRRLEGNLKANGVAWDENKAKIQEWAAAIQETTRFSDTEAYSALERMVRITGDLGEAQSATRLAMNLSVLSGADMNRTFNVLADLLNGSKGALLQISKEFGAYVGNAKTAQEVLDNLTVSTRGAAVSEDSFRKSITQSKNAFEDFKEEIGSGFLPAIEFVTRGGTNLLRVFQTLGAAIAANVAIGISAFRSLGDVVRNVFNWKELKKSATEGLAEIKRLTQITTDDIKNIWDKHTNDVNVLGQKRLTAKDLDDSQYEEKVRASNERLIQMEQDLQLKLDALSAKNLEQKLAYIDSEEKAVERKINKEIGDEDKKNKAIQAARALYAKRGIDLMNAETKARTEAAYDVLSTSVQALQIVNSLHSSGTRAQVTRTIALIAIEKALAIARLWSAEASKGVIGIATATAGTGLLVAQFAQQTKAVKQAARVAGSADKQFAVETNLGNGQTLTEFSGGTEVGGQLVGGGAIGVGGAITPSGGGGGGSIIGGGGGGGGPTVINVGGVAVYFNADSVNLNEIDAVARRLAEAVKRGSVEASQAALVFFQSGKAQSGLAQ